jgi:predicted nucleotidyltransferase
MKEADLIKAVDGALDKEIRVLAVYLLGSGARGELRKDSDIDLGLLLEPGEKMSPMERTGLANRLSYSLGRCADLGLINSRNLVYTKEALFTGKRIYAG